MSRLFYLMRDEDVSGFGATGLVAEGIEFNDGRISLRWCVPGQPRSTVTWDSIQAAERIHGHGGRTRIVWASGPEGKEIMNTVTEGQIVHYTRQNIKHCVAAVIVRTWNPKCVNLRLFLDGSNDPDIAEWATSISESDELDGTYAFWHWPHECPREQS